MYMDIYLPKNIYGKLDNDKIISSVVLGTYFGLRNSST